LAKAVRLWDPVRMVELCVATDLSPAALPAVEMAFRWAHVMRASVLLLHVVHDPALAPAFTSDAPGDVVGAQKELERLAAQFAPPSHIDVRAAEDVAKAIVDASAKCDFLFVGSHGRSGFQRLRLGSVAMAVLRQSRVPVVCSPPPRSQP
jgi:nucleotide-binding universal stress UspA family protein